MLSISHALTGAFIAVKVSNPYLAIPLIILSHYLEDAVPHWDVGTGLGKGTKASRDAFRHELLDLALTIIFLFVYFHPPLTPLSSLLSSPAIWGALLALLPDFLEAPRNFLGFELRILAPLNRFHHSFHHSIPRILDGLAPQLLLLTLLWFFH